MKVIFKIIAGLVFAALFACGGAALENHRALQYAKAHADDMLSIIGVAACKNFLGVLVVSKDGTIFNVPGADPEAAHNAAVTLPENHSTLITLPCGAGDQTT